MVVGNEGGFPLLASGGLSLYGTLCNSSVEADLSDERSNALSVAAKEAGRPSEYR